MLNLKSNITITQQPTQSFTDRNNKYVLNFVNDCEIDSSWKNLTDTAKLTLPKKVYVKTDDGNTAWAGKDVYAKSDTAPILMRGDRIKIELGYYYQPVVHGAYITQMNTEFEGFITKINPKIPMEIECEDNMWLLKQAQCPNMVFPDKSNSATYKDAKGVTKTVKTADGKDWTSQSIITTLLSIATVSESNVYLQNILIPALAKIKVINGVGASENLSTNLGDFRTQNETICAILFRFRKDYKMECFFRGDNLYCSGVVYYPSEYIGVDGEFIATAYDFEQNITSDEMVYLRKDDMRLGIKAYSVNKNELVTANKDGKLKTKQKRLETSVGDTDGELRTQFFWNVKDVAELKQLATQRLSKLKYEGWRGQFTSFGIPYVRHGQAISLNSKITPERNGTYLVKGTKVKFGVNNKPAFSRTIDPHIRIDNGIYTVADFANGL